MPQKEPKGNDVPEFNDEDLQIIRDLLDDITPEQYKDQSITEMSDSSLQEAKPQENGEEDEEDEEEEEGDEELEEEPPGLDYGDDEEDPQALDFGEDSDENSEPPESSSLGDTDEGEASDTQEGDFDLDSLGDMGEESEESEGNDETGELSSEEEDLLSGLPDMDTEGDGSEEQPPSTNEPATEDQAPDGKTSGEDESDLDSLLSDLDQGQQSQLDLGEQEATSESPEEATSESEEESSELADEDLSLAEEGEEEQAPTGSDDSDVGLDSLNDPGALDQGEQETTPEDESAGEGEDLLSELPDIGDTGEQSGEDNTAQPAVEQTPAAEEGEEDPFSQNLEQLFSDDFGATPQENQEEEAGQETEEDSGLGSELDDLPDLGEETAAPTDEASTGLEDEIPPLEGDILEQEESPAQEETAEESAPTEEPAISDDMGDMDALMSELSEDEQPKEEEKDSFDLSEDDLERIKEVLTGYSFGVRQAVKRAIVEDLFAPDDMRQLIDLILHRAPEKQVKKFINKKGKINVDSLSAPSERRVVGAKDKYSLASLQRRHKVVQYTKAAAVIFAIGLILGMLTYRFVYRPLKADSLFDKGVALIKREGNEATQKPDDYGQAEKLFDRGLEYSPEDIDAYNDFALAYMDRRRFDRAKQKLFKAQKINKKNRNYDAMTYYHLGLYHMRSRRPRKLESDKKKLPWDEAARDYFRKANRFGNNLLAIEAIGRTYLLQKEYKKAETYYKKVVKKDPEHIAGHSSLLNLYINLDTPPKVLRKHQEIRQLDLEEDMNKFLRAKLAGYYMEQENVRIKYNIDKRFRDNEDTLKPVAQSVLRRLVTQYPEFPEGRYQLARYHKKTNAYRKAFIQLEDTVKLDQHHFRAHTLMAEMLLEREEIMDAYKHLRQAVQSYQKKGIDKTHPYKPQEGLGKTYSLLGDLFYNHAQAVSRNPKLDVLDKEDYATKTNLVHAQKYYQAAQKMGYSTPQQSYNLGRIYYNQGSYAKALENWLSIQSQSYTNPNILFAMGNSFYKLDKIDAAKGEYKKLIDDYENKAATIGKPKEGNEYHKAIYEMLSASYNNLGAIYDRKGNEREAMLNYWRAIERSKYLNSENPQARLNINRSFKGTGRLEEPVLDEQIPQNISPIESGTVLN